MFTFARPSRRSRVSRGNRLFTDCRLPYAAKLLAEHPELSVAEVARASGFPSADTFSRNFKQRYALTPTQYREQQLIA